MDGVMRDLEEIGNVYGGQDASKDRSERSFSRKVNTLHQQYGYWMEEVVIKDNIYCIANYILEKTFHK